jgi:hypothetical protein
VVGHPLRVINQPEVGHPSDELVPRDRLVDLGNRLA